NRLSAREAVQREHSAGSGAPPGPALARATAPRRALRLIVVKLCPDAVPTWAFRAVGSECSRGPHRRRRPPEAHAFPCSKENIMRRRNFLFLSGSGLAAVGLAACGGSGGGGGGEGGGSE